MEEKELPKRKRLRLSGFDYSNSGIYFITVCTKDRKKILSKIVTPRTQSVVGTGVPDCPESGVPDCPEKGVPDCPKPELTIYGMVVEKYLNQMNEFYEHISVLNYVIMPNHIHVLLYVKDNGQSRTPVPTGIVRANSAYSKFVSTLKRFCNKEIGENIWQSRSHDHIIRNSDDYDKHLRYILENPKNWYYDELYSEE